MKEVKTNSFQAWFLAARPKTLSAAAVPVLVGSALAYSDADSRFRWLPCILCLLFAFIMQIDANFINDWFDFVHGSDREDRLGPRRACAQGWITAKAMKRGIVLTAALACGTGLPLVYYGGWEVVGVGIACVLFAFLYTLKFSYMGWGDVLVLLFFGIVPVGFTYYVQLHCWTREVTMAAVACGLVIDTLLMVNNYRDREQDTASGKKTVVVRWGANVGLKGYLILGIAACTLCLGYACTSRYGAAFLPLAYLPPHFMAWKKMERIRQGKGLNAVLADTARNIFLFGFLLASGLALSAFS